MEMELEIVQEALKNILCFLGLDILLANVRNCDSECSERAYLHYRDNYCSLVSSPLHFTPPPLSCTLPKLLQLSSVELGDNIHKHPVTMRKYLRNSKTYRY